MRRDKDKGWQTVLNKNKRKPKRPNFIFQADHSKPMPRSPTAHHGAGSRQQHMAPPLAKRSGRDQQQQRQRPGIKRPGGSRAPVQHWQNFRGGANADDGPDEECPRCLGTNHNASACLAREKECRSCGRIGHLARACDYY